MSSDECYQNYLKSYLKNSSNLAVFLDYDGTLTPIVSHPDLAIIPEETKAILERLSQKPNIFIAIISGRNVHNVKEMVGINHITYAGNHGLEVIYPDGTTYIHQLPADFKKNVQEMIKILEKEVVRDGAWIENKGASLTFHYRSIPEFAQYEIEEKARRIIEAANFKVNQAHCALEVKPKIDWNKGKVALMLLEKKYGKDWKKNMKVIFAGDDTTDEDAMKALKGNAATFRIVTSPDVETNADIRVSSVDDIVNILKIIEEMYRKKK